MQLFNAFTAVDGTVGRRDKRLHFNSRVFSLLKTVLNVNFLY